MLLPHWAFSADLPELTWGMEPVDWKTCYTGQNPTLPPGGRGICLCFVIFVLFCYCVNFWYYLDHPIPSPPPSPKGAVFGITIHLSVSSFIMAKITHFYSILSISFLPHGIDYSHYGVWTSSAVRHVFDRGAIKWPSSKHKYNSRNDFILWLASGEMHFTCQTLV